VVNETVRDWLASSDFKGPTMPEPDDPWTDKTFEAQVRDTAYFLWENDGRPSGREKEYWFRALERCLRQREADGLLREAPPRGLRSRDDRSGEPPK
jgi:hypothetical protein